MRRRTAAVIVDIHPPNSLDWCHEQIERGFSTAEVAPIRVYRHHSAFDEGANLIRLISGGESVNVCHWYAATGNDRLPGEGFF